MREILFRGKRIDGGWIEGDYINWTVGNPEIAVEYNTGHKRSHEVVPETVGQYTGLTDKNGKKIFEGDIIKSCEYSDIYTVKYFGDDNYPAFDCVPEVSNCKCNGLSFLVNVEGCEVIGNIHDNPEFLEVWE